MLEILWVFIAGLGAGVVTGIFGGSDTLIVVPIMIILAGFGPYTAIGLGLSTDIFSSLAAYLVFRRKKQVDYGTAMPMAAFATIGVFAGSLVSQGIPVAALTMLSGVGCCLVGFRFFHGKHVIGKKPKKVFMRSAILGLCVGFILGTWGAGGGVALLLALTYFMGLPVHKAVGTSMVVMVPVSLLGGFIHFTYQPFSLIVLAVGALGGVIGSVSSSELALRLPDKKLIIISGVCIFISGMSLVAKALGLF